MISLILDVDKDTFSDSPSWVPNWNALSKSLAQPEYIMNSDFLLRLKSKNYISIDGSRLTVAVIWKEVVLQIPNTFDPMDLQLFLSDSDHFAASCHQVLLLAQWISLFCRKSPTEEQDSNESEESDGENISDADSGTTSRKRTYDAIAAYKPMDDDPNSRNTLRIGAEDFYDNWCRLVDDVLPAFATIGALHPTAHFEAACNFIRNDPDARGWQWERGLNESTHRGAVEVMVQKINKFSVQRRRLFSTTLGTPGSISGSIDLKYGDLVAQLEGVYWPLVLRRTDTALDE